MRMLRIRPSIVRLTPKGCVPCRKKSSIGLPSCVRRSEPLSARCYSIKASTNAAAKFTFRVSEYLKGSGGSTVTAYRVFGAPFDTTEEATAKAVAMLAERDTQWDQREAIVMLGTPHSDYAPSTIVGTNIYLLVWGDGYDLHDYYYSLHSKRARAWLPARYTPPDTSPGRGVAPEPSFLRSVPGGNATSTPATIGERNPGSTYESTTDNISLSDLKAKITTLMVEYNGGDGSAEYKECVRDKYRHKRHVRNWPTDEGHPYTPWKHPTDVGSGLPSAILSYLEGIDYEYTPPAPGTEYEPPVPAAYTFTGPNGGLFEIATTYTLGDYKNDGTIDRAYLKLNMQSTVRCPRARTSSSCKNASLGMRSAGSSSSITSW